MAGREGWVSPEAVLGHPANHLVHCRSKASSLVQGTPTTITPMPGVPKGLTGGLGTVRLEVRLSSSLSVTSTVRRLKSASMKTVPPIIAIFVTIASSAVARPVRYLTYAQLMEESDLVVIVHALETRSAKEGDPIVPVEPVRDYLTPIITKFEVLAVLKGKQDSKNLELCHYKYKPDAPGVLNGPLLAWFPTRDGDVIRHSNRHGVWMVHVPTDFMLFLKRDDEGRLTFMTGQIDAEASVRQVHDPFPFSMRPDP